MAIDDTIFILDTDTSYDPTKNYYTIHEVTNEAGEVIDTVYQSAYLSSTVYTPNTYYIDINGNKVLSTDNNYDPSLTYYTFNSLNEEEIISIGGYDRLVSQCSSEETFDDTV